MKLIFGLSVIWLFIEPKKARQHHNEIAQALTYRCVFINK